MDNKLIIEIKNTDPVEQCHSGLAIFGVSHGPDAESIIFLIF